MPEEKDLFKTEDLPATQENLTGKADAEDPAAMENLAKVFAEKIADKPVEAKPEPENVDPLDTRGPIEIPSVSREDFDELMKALKATTEPKPAEVPKTTDTKAATQFEPFKLELGEYADPDIAKTLTAMNEHYAKQFEAMAAPKADDSVRQQIEVLMGEMVRRTVVDPAFAEINGEFGGIFGEGSKISDEASKSRIEVLELADALQRAYGLTGKAGNKDDAWFIKVAANARFGDKRASTKPKASKTRDASTGQYISRPTAPVSRDSTDETEAEYLRREAAKRGIDIPL